MPGPWDRENGWDGGQIGGLPMSGLLSELLASEGVDAAELVEDPSALQRLSPVNLAADPVQAEPSPLEIPDAAPAPAPCDELPVALPGLAAQLWALSEAATADFDSWPEAVAAAAEPVTPESSPEPEAILERPQDPDPVSEPHAFAIPGLLLTLAEETAAPEPPPEPEVKPEPELEPAHVVCAEPQPEPAACVTPEPLIEIVEAAADELPDIQLPLPHGRSNDLSNLIGAIDSEIAASPDLPAGKAHEFDQSHERFVCFRLGGISYGIHMRLVREVDRIGRVTQVPGAPKLVCGLINLRGEILPLIDTRLLLELEPSGWPVSGYLLVVQSDPDEQPVALLADELGGVALVDPAGVETDMSELEHSIASHALGMTEHRGRFVLLLDHRNLVTPEALMASAESGSSN
jgi:purine-binding chemotaxis protein CheW